MNSKSHLRCVLVGGQSILVACAELLIKEGHSITAVVSDDRDVIAWCSQRGLTRFAARSSYGDALAGQPFDYLFSIANYNILPAAILTLPEKAAINFHDGPLPSYAGLNATTWALLNHETRHAVTWHLMDSAVDKGEILKQRELPINPGDTALTLNARCYEVALRCFGELVHELAHGSAKSTPQERTGFRLFTRCQRPAPACLLDWRRPARELETLWRALAFGPYRNPIGVPKVRVGNRVYAVETMELADGAADRPGLITAMDDNGVRVATPAGQVRLGRLTTLSGTGAAAAEVCTGHGLQVGDELPVLADTALEMLGHRDREACSHEAFWLDRIDALEPLDIPFRTSHRAPATSRAVATRRQAIPESLRPAPGGKPDAMALLVSWWIYLARITGKSRFHMGYRPAGLREEITGHEEFFATHVPFPVDLDPAGSFEACCDAAKADFDAVNEHFTFSRDLLLRRAGSGSNIAAIEGAMAEVGAERVATLRDYRPDSTFNLGMVIPDDGCEVLWTYNPESYDESTIVRMGEQFEILLAALKRHAKTPVMQLSVLPARERELLADWNDTATAYEPVCIHRAFEEQARRTPDAQALVFRDEILSYSELDARADRLARRLRANGVKPDQMVGLLLGRATHMVVAMLGILKAGGAYVPLDPAYPRDRLLYMMDDSQLRVVVTEEQYEELISGVDAVRVHVDDAWSDASATEREEHSSGPDDLAYVIYTSGSTGKPKGVMVAHRNVANFFAAMDQRIDGKSGGAWLAVTSISFDISVLEILWSLTRGLTVVLYSGDDRDPSLSASCTGPIDFSLYYFPSDDGNETTDKLRLLLEGTRFADANGFDAVWTPERHFHAFGGLFPNPSVSSAALAAITKNVKIRAGSCVLPLHHPVRVAEEWSFVDNLSNGRVGIAFASGWQPDDFVLAPQNYADRNAVMYQSIATVRALWRGETVTLPGGSGNPVAIAIKPRPVQKELPFWITAAGNPETYRQAGEMGANLLTHLLGQSLDEVAGKLKIYRDARRQHGHPGEGYVTLMLHTLVGPDEDYVRSKAHDALKNYLATAAGLIKHYASSFPTFKAHMSAGRNVDEIFATLAPRDVDALLEHAVARYYETSGLFGTPMQCEAMVDRCKAAGVDEIACLVDFGMEPQVALEHLPYLAELRVRTSRGVEDAAADYSIPALIERHGVTHFQCTPSMATMLVSDRRGREALRRVRQMMVGGEAFPPPLAAELRSLLQGDLINMYGPTETTVWSSTHRIATVDGAIAIGRPIANTALYVLDVALQPVPVGVPGELYIGGDGVVRGYWNRPELTAERFLPDPFSHTPGARMYRTGDLVRYGTDGSLEFLGRMDNQVKIRGYRIELGEIESLLRSHPAVREAVVSVRDESGAKRLAAYLVLKPGESVDPARLRAFLGTSVAEFMIPASFTLMQELPLTPNGKVDRRALPEPREISTSGEYVAPATQTESQIAEAWQLLLKKDRVGVNDDFFHIGGDSLGAVQLVAMLSDTFGVELPLETIFHAPTIVTLAKTVDDLIGGGRELGVA